MPGQTVVEVGYVGSKVIKLGIDRDIDAVPNSALSTSPVRDQAQINFLSENVANPFAGLLPGTTMNGSTIPRQQLLRPLSQFAGVIMRDYQGYSWYHALQSRFERRFRGGLTALAGYTWSKTMGATEYLNPGDPAPYRVIQAADRPHHFTFSGIYELPFGKGRHFGGGMTGVANLLAGGWQLASIWQWTAGEPIAFGNVLFADDINNIALSKDARTIDRWFNTDAGFEKGAARQLASNLRTFPLRLSGLRSGTYNSWDISAVKYTTIHERHQFQFRAEFLNAFNHPTAFTPPNTSPTSSAFGFVTGNNGLPRVVQLGMKYVF
jgi:hypothetical protein